MKGHTIHVKKMHLPRGMNRTKGGSRFDTVAAVVHRPSKGEYIEHVQNASAIGSA